MRRVALLAVLALSLLAGWRSLRAQTVTSDDLAAAALAVSDVPGFQFVSESVTPPPADFDATYTRIFATDESGGALLVDALLLPGSSIPTAGLAAVLSGDALFRNVAVGLQLSVENFRLTGPLGIADADQSAVWDAIDSSGQPLVFYAEAFLQGRLLALIVYAAPPGSADPTQLTAFASLQDQKLLASNLPPVVVTPGAQTVPASPAAPAPQPVAVTSAPSSDGGTHGWYTSAASNATTYYCDDDPDWQTLSPQNLRAFSSVAALLAAYPGRRLHRPCGDGATGP